MPLGWIHPEGAFRGKAVQIRCGPATVSGDESRNSSLPDPVRREEAAGRTIHESGNLDG
ncbi:hypothetical protein DSCO28_12110 [Desulfosarcina ovata subsp. sediminis]|uniref:Uncharacterized protein n=1 Tax=Desulfosarcina ovata subsp. sediminis TaxID=885957 RepID=A0A5K7ZK74_9BACT|nr:hypothetical protein DSCO28_12110 [Desulfosarcina ovata subsp. sediminis]